MPTARRGLLRVPGADLYHEVRGSGPALLIIPTGNGDATPFGPLADLLADRFTVITYDRRGFSRSPQEHPSGGGRRRLADDVDDACRLLDEVAGEPGHVLGGSSGAIVALALLERHPDRVRTVVCHEPPLAAIMPDARRWLGVFTALHATYLRSGPEAAMAEFRAAMGMTETTRPPADLELPPDRLAELLGRLRRNQLFWFEYEMREYPAVLPDLAALRAVAGQLVLAGGDTSRDGFPYRPNLILAARLGVPVVHFPGGHVGYVTHPVEFAAMLPAVLGGTRAGLPGAFTPPPTP